jgi:hypothetical protein
VNQTKEFYDAWASQQMTDEKRDVILKWKAVNFLNLLLRNNLVRHDKVCEIGGAEGILLNVLDKVITINSLHNYDISSIFCEAGKIKYPGIQFYNYEFITRPELYDLVLLSDITEHVENDHEFLGAISAYCTYAVIKIPIEKALVNSAFFHALRFKKIPKELRYGKDHINGHLRGYAIHDAYKLIAEYFELIDHEVSAVSYFNPSRKKKWLKKILGKQIFVRIYGGAYFAIGKSKFKKSL